MALEQQKIDIALAFKDAWKGFKGWWIPLCIASSILLFTQSWLPNLIIRNFPEFNVVDKYIENYDNFIESVDSGSDPVQAVSTFTKKIKDLNEHPETLRKLKVLFYKMLLLFCLLLVSLSILNVIIILMSKFSLSNKKVSLKDNLRKPITLTPSYLLLTIIKLIPFFFFIIPGVYIYIKLYFTGFIITENSANPFTAMKESWNLSDGIFWEILSIFLLTLVIDLVSIITIIGFIPGTSFKYTLRASLYKQALLNRKS